MFCKKGFLRNFTKFAGKHKCQSQACNFIKKENLARVFSCEFCEIFKNTLFHRTPLVAASGTSTTIWCKLVAFTVYTITFLLNYKEPSNMQDSHEAFSKAFPNVFSGALSLSLILTGVLSLFYRYFLI